MLFRSKLVGLACQRRGSSVINCSYSSPLYFFPNLKRYNFGGTREKTPRPHQFSILPFSRSLQLNTHKINFLSTFLFFIFYPPCFTPTKPNGPLGYSMVIASVFPWDVTNGIKTNLIIPYELGDNAP